jgi:isopenicillin N synthase-like dioxygenase
MQNIDDFKACSHYPSIAIEENQFNTAPHVHGDFITFLAQSKVPGLRIRTRSRKWIQTPVLPETFLVNSGELLR